MTVEIHPRFGAQIREVPLHFGKLASKPEVDVLVSIATTDFRIVSLGRVKVSKAIRSLEFLIRHIRRLSRVPGFESRPKRFEFFVTWNESRNYLKTFTSILYLLCKAL